MNKYQESLNRIKDTTFYECSTETPVFYENDEDIENLQVLIERTKPSPHYTKQQLIDELDKVYTLARQHDDDLIHYSDIYRLIELLEDPQ